MIGRESIWTKKQITEAMATDRNGLDRSVLIQYKAIIKRCHTDSATWHDIDQIKREVGHAS